jgi:hypothetical protein
LFEEEGWNDKVRSYISAKGTKAAKLSAFNKDS